jgi:dipicolinate synthase subunit A
VNYAIIGGDMRFKYLAELIENGNTVKTYGLFDDDKIETATLQETIINSDIVILPLPIINKTGKINTPLRDIEISLRDVLDCVRDNQIVMAGNPDKPTRMAFFGRGIELIDYYNREELKVRSADATAEAVINIIISESNEKINGMSVLIIGFGRIGKLVAHKLKMLGADVTVTSRKNSDKSWCEAYGYKTADSGDLCSCIGGKSIIINTVPVTLMGKKELETVERDAIIIDTASQIGYDKPEAERLGLKVIDAPGLPGKVSAKTAGRDIFETIEQILREREL